MIGSNISKAIVASIVIISASFHATAFLSESSKDTQPKSTIDVGELLRQVHVDVESNLKQPEKLAKLDQALNAVDESLDFGSDQEELLLETRDALVELRLTVLDEQAKQLTAHSHPVIRVPKLPRSPINFGGFGGGTIGGGGGMAGGGLGLSGSLLPLGAAVTAVSLATTVSTDDDSPGTATSN